MNKKTSFTAIALSLGLAAASNAAIISIASITYVGTAPAQTGLNLDNPNNLINGSGLSASVTDANISTVTHAPVTFTAPGNVWATTDPGPAGGDFFAQGGTVVFEIVFTQAHRVDNFANWGYHFGSPNGNSISQINLDYGVGSYADGTITGLAIAPPPTVSSATITGLGGIIADRVRITVTDNYFGTYTGGDRVGLAEVAFQSLPSVPEPSSTTLLGLGGLALILRRRK